MIVRGSGYPGALALPRTCCHSASLTAASRSARSPRLAIGLRTSLGGADGQEQGVFGPEHGAELLGELLDQELVVRIYTRHDGDHLAVLHADRIDRDRPPLSADGIDRGRLLRDVNNDLFPEHDLVRHRRLFQLHFEGRGLACHENLAARGRGVGEDVVR